MKLFTTLYCTITASAAIAVAAPGPGQNIKVDHQRSTLGPPRLDPRADPRCSRSLDDVSTIADAGASGEYIVAYTAGGGGIAYYTCQLLTGRGVGPVRPDECAPLAGLIAASTAVIYTAVQNSKQGTQSNGRRGAQRESSLATLLRLHLANETLESIRDMAGSGTLVQEKYDRKNSTVASVVDRVSVLGIEHAHGRADVLVTTYDDDTGIVRGTPSPNTTSGWLIKRHDGPGFKINYRTISYSGNVLGTPDFGNLYKDLANGIANNWAVRADNDKIDELIGTTDVTDPKILTFGFRIIAETDGFGENYESVDICENLVPTHDEL
ncbi:hypothetical protein N0V82_007611 [Gnomoniopsis sp. IMI 355080]|nr:hypothetical protein N0V82_007611 [Gnomoniopsis sp. IMI 355080]